MQHITALLPSDSGKRPQSATSSSISGCTELAEMREIAREITAGMSALYGQKFRAQWPSVEGWRDAIIEWAKSLQPYGKQAIRDGFDGLKQSGAAWPPSLPEFLDVVRTSSRPEHRTFVALPRPKSDPGTVALAIQVMRESLR
jgi:hypothetical protein